MRKDFQLSPEQRADAREALQLLHGSGLTLAAAAKRAIANQWAVQRIKVDHCADLFLRSKLGVRRPGTVRWYEENLTRITRQFGAFEMDQVSRREFREWLATLAVKKKGASGRALRAALARCARALWRWAAKHEPPLAASDPTTGVEFSAPASERTKRGVLTVAQCEAIMAGAGRFRSALALAIFAGVRPEEIAGKNKPWLQWEHVNVDEKWIRIPEEISKTGRARIMEKLPDVLWRWLTPAALHQTISPVNWRALQGTAARLAGYGPANKWPQDALRHTAASYLLALKQDSGIVANWLGHEDSPRMLHAKYFGLVRQPDALKWAALAPVHKA